MNTLARLAIIFAGIIAAGAFLNVYIFAASFVLTPALEAMGLTQEQSFSLVYWLCFAAGAVTAFFVMRPIYRLVGKKSAGKGASANQGNPPARL